MIAASVRRSPNAFTLIELLVVVSIIAILAAIAVPNFLEAQTRARTAATLNDLRTMATAIESYLVDNNRPPYDGEPGFVYWGWVNVESQLTTPVAYLSSLPFSAFQDPSVTQPTRPGHSHFIGSRHVYDYSTAYWNDLENDSNTKARWMRQFGNSKWKMSSPGPDRRFVNLGSYFGMADIYDPTNGTISDGDIIRSQNGNRQFAPNTPVPN